jgi:hypothetical protein
MRIPKNISFEEAASIPEAFLTAYQNLIEIGKLEKVKIKTYKGTISINSRRGKWSRNISNTIIKIDRMQEHHNHKFIFKIRIMQEVRGNINPIA